MASKAFFDFIFIYLLNCLFLFAASSRGGLKSLFCFVRDIDLEIPMQVPITNVRM